MTSDGSRPPAARSRAPVAVAACLVVTAGLATARFAAGPAGDALGDALYAALVLLLLTLVVPRCPPVARATVALALCWTVEVAQATGGPAAAVSVCPVLRYVLGTTFAWPDLVAYTAGVALAAVVMGWSSRRRPVRSASGSA